jgi:hypothetical protein
MVGATGAVGFLVALQLLASAVHPRRRGLPRTAQADATGTGSHAHPYVSSGSAGKRPRPRQFGRAKRSIRAGKSRPRTREREAATRQAPPPRAIEASAETEEGRTISSTRPYRAETAALPQDDQRQEPRHGEFGFER